MVTNSCPFFGADSKAEHVTVADVQMHAESGCPHCLLLRAVAAKLTRQDVFFDAAHMREYGWRRVSYMPSPKSSSTDIEIFVEEDTPKLFPQLQHRLLTGDIPSKGSLSCAKRWISQCSAKHKSYQQPSSRPLPKRVVDVEGTTVRLLETTTKQCGQYIALSHCWGSSRPQCLTTRSTRAVNMRGIPWELLPTTFRDAIQVTKGLGIRYLWIDSLCIIQDDDVDWKEESSKMVSIYQNSFLTICATAAPDDETGLWPRVAPTQMAEKVTIKHAGREYEVYVRNKEDEDHVNAVHFRWNHSWVVQKLVENICPLMSRGWTFQERLLVPRLLHYGHGEMLWQCPELASCECCFSAADGSKYLARRLHPTNLARQMQASNSREHVAEKWRLLVMPYTLLYLTLSKDVLPALSGLAKVFLSARPGDVYLAGLWKSSIIYDLCWDVYVPNPLPRPEKWRAPTWSWASVHRNVGYTCDGSEKNRIYARLVRASTVLTGPDPTGEVLSGSVVLIAPVKAAKVRRIHRYLYDVAADSFEIECRGDSSTDFDTGLIRVGMTVFCARLRTQYDGRDWMLVLAAVEDGRPNIYRRIGMATPRTKDTDRHWFGSGSHEMEIEIV